MERPGKKEEDLPYNKPFTDGELKIVIKQQKNTVPGEDTIHYALETLKYLLDMYNRIWK